MTLNDKIEKIFFKKRFNLFVLSNFLQKKVYNELRDNYPSIDLFKKKHDNFSRSIKNNHPAFNNLLKRNKAWKKFINEIESNEFSEDLIKIFNLKYVYLLENDWKKYIPGFQKIKFDFTFNISEKGGFSMPHTDSTNKLISLNLFFVDDSWSKKNGGIVNFYKPKNIYLENNWRNKKVEKKNLDIIKTIIPAPNMLYAFKKTENSYHSVEPVNDVNSLNRKSFMINLIYENKSDIPYYKKTIKNKLKNMYKFSNSN